MRIRELSIENFEGIVSQSLYIGAPKKMQLIYGANEAGKSRTLRAIYSALFGFSGASASAQSGKVPSQITMSLERPGGSSLTFIRKPGRSAKALSRPSGEPLTDAELGEWIPSLSKDTFMSTHGLTQKTLEDGARQLLAEKGEFGRLLFGAALGTTWLTERLQSLSAHAEQLYSNRATTKPLNLSLQGFDQAQRAVREQTQNPETILEQERALAEAQAEQATLTANLKALARQKSDKESILRLHKHAEAWTKARRELGTLRPEDVTLSDNEIADWCTRLDTLATRTADLPRLEIASRNASEEAERAAKASGVSEATIAGLPNDLRLLMESVGKRLGELDRVRREVQSTLREQRVLLDTVTARAQELSEESYKPQLDSLYEEGAALLQDFKHALSALARLKGLQRDAEQQRTALGVGQQSLANFVMPEADTLAEHVQTLRRLREDLARKANDRERLNEKRLEMLARKDREFPESIESAKEALQTTRAQRNQTWSQIRATGGPLGPIEIETYERLVAQSDHLADTLARDAAKLEAERTFKQEMQDTERRLAQNALDERAYEQALAALQKEWNALWPAALTHDAPAIELGIQWRERVATLQNTESEIARLQELRAGLDERRSLFLSRVYDTLVLLNGPQASVADNVRLEDVLVRIKTLRENEHRLQTERATVEAQRADLTRAVAVALGRQQELEQEAAHYKATWDATLAKHGLPLSLDPEQATRLVRDLEELGRKQEAAATQARAVQDAKKALASLKAEADQLRIALRPEDTTPLRDHLLTLQATKHRRERLLDTEQQAARELEDSATPGESIEDRVKEILSMDPVELRIDLATLGTQYDNADAELQAQTQTVLRLNLALEVAKRPGEAAQESMAEAQFHLAAIKRQAEDYVRTQVAIHAVKRAIARYREENEGTVLARARQLFLHFTAGAYGRLELHHEDQKLLCVRQDGFAATVEMLSDGTRDQLYLALRLAALEELAARSEPMPLILDDVLVNFDDERTALAFDALGDFASTSQVIMFTHHRRTWDIAKKRLRGRIDLHELGKSSTVSEDPEIDEQLALL